MLHMHKYKEDPRETMATTSPPGCDSPFVPTFLGSSSPSQLRRINRSINEVGIGPATKELERQRELLTGLRLETV